MQYLRMIISIDLKSYYKSIWLFSVILITWCKDSPHEFKILWGAD